jgi:hypothetical protein
MNFDGVDSFCAGLLDGINTIETKSPQQRQLHPVLRRSQPRLQLESTRKQLQLLGDVGRPVAGNLRPEDPPVVIPRVANALARFAKTHAGISDFLHHERKY